jgi:hypothetical protein
MTFIYKYSFTLFIIYLINLVVLLLRFVLLESQKICDIFETIIYFSKQHIPFLIKLCIKL